MESSQQSRGTAWILLPNLNATSALLQPPPLLSWAAFCPGLCLFGVEYHQISGRRPTGSPAPKEKETKTWIMDLDPDLNLVAGACVPSRFAPAGMRRSVSFVEGR
ncbi:Cutinase transcription factor 1 beta [Fusarium oxysporum f. sp. albedinis]|nr:Cutinase transcription factor 1 beta [Fusarium oxysporum f. sp. albedinis]